MELSRHNGGTAGRRATAGRRSQRVNEAELHSSSIRAATGAPLETARAVLVLIHGRGDSAHGILGLAPELPVPGLAYVAPEATHNVWYPESFLQPLERNQPWLDAALAAIGGLVEGLLERGFPAERIGLLGFSQGACLATEYAARNPRRYGALAGLSGGLIGPDGTPRDYPGSLDGTPVFLGCGDMDHHIPVGRVHETAQVLERMGGSVEERIYAGFPHSVNRDEIDYVQGMLEAMAGD